jgi:hypothetical protein
LQVHRRRRRNPSSGVSLIQPSQEEGPSCLFGITVRLDHNIGTVCGKMQQKPCFHPLSTMVSSTRRKDYNDSSVQNLGDGQKGATSNQVRASQPFNQEAEFRKLQKLVQTQAKEIATLKTKGATEEV